MRVRFGQLLPGAGFIFPGGCAGHVKESLETALNVSDGLNYEVEVEANQEVEVRDDTMLVDEKMAQILVEMYEKFDQLRLLNIAMETIAFTMADAHEERCRELIIELLRMIVCIQVQLTDLAEQSGSRDEFEKLIDQKLLEIGDSESETFQKIRDTKPDIFDKINVMVMDALDQIDFDPDEYEVAEFTDVPAKAHLLQSWLHRDGRTVKDGLAIVIRDGKLGEVVFYDEESQLYRVDFEDGKAEVSQQPIIPQLTQTTASSSPLPVLGAIAALAAAVAIKIKSKKIQSKPQQVQEGAK